MELIDRAPSKRGSEPSSFSEPLFLKPGECLPGTNIEIRQSFAEPWGFKIKGRIRARVIPLEPDTTVKLDASDIRRWRLASALTWDTNDRDGTEHFFADRSNNWPTKFDLLELEKRAIIGLTAASLVYGGLHLFAWNASFQSPVQGTLWRLSGCVVACGVPVMAVGLFLGNKIDPISAEPHVLREFLREVSDIILHILASACVVLVVLLLFGYILARAYLVVECFVSLSHMQAEVYDVPAWSVYFPHIS